MPAANSHRPNSKAKAMSGDQRPITTGRTSAVTTLTPNAHFSRAARLGISSAFQRAMGPMPIRKTAGAMSGKNTASK